MITASIFDVLKDILYTKTGKYHEHLAETSNYMLQRWCSMHSAEPAFIINETTNRWITQINDKELVYKLLLKIIPKQKFKKINYLKKSNFTNEENIPSNFELSNRELALYRDTFNTLNLYD